MTYKTTVLTVKRKKNDVRVEVETVQLTKKRFAELAKIEGLNVPKRDALPFLRFRLAKLPTRMFMSPTGVRWTMAIIFSSKDSKGEWGEWKEYYNYLTMEEWENFLIPLKS